METSKWIRKCVNYINFIVIFLLNLYNYSGFHQAIIHNQANMLSRLLELVQKYPNLHSNINDQNALFQVPVIPLVLLDLVGVFVMNSIANV